MAHDSGSHGRLVDGRYRLGEPLGRGGMGTVWLAFDELLRRDVAVKEVRIPDDLDEMETQGRCERALREARAAARITHPNVVTIFDVAEDDGRPWIVMELVRAPSLTDVLEEGRMAPHEAAEVGLAVLAALRAARAADVLHRDVKPSNILMAPGGRIVLTDFGIATVAGSVTLTATGMLVGSPEYLAPERVLGRRPGPASDLWSLGVTLYQAVEGFSPFRRTGAMDTLSAVLTDEPAPPRQSGALWPAIEALLRKDPLERADEDDTERLLMAAMVSGGAPVPQEPSAEPIPPGTATVEDPGGVRGVTRSSWQQAPQSPETPHTPQMPPPIWQQEPPVSPAPPFGAVSRADPDGATGGYPLTGSHAYSPADAVHGSETADDRPNPVLIGAAAGAAAPGDRAAKKRRKTILLGGMVAAAVTALAICVPAAMGGQSGNGGNSDAPRQGGSSQGASAAANPQGTGNRSDVLHTAGGSAGTGQSGTGTSGNSSQGGGSTRTSRPTTSNTGNPSTSRPPTSRPPTTTSPPRTTAPATTRPPIDPTKGGGGASGAPRNQGDATAAN
ncbi:protein kinase [Embleya sp. NBC_00888]|uniref:serine/threonine-protein kinase n=1 Tax=Embleya sp. NBC_00888 TaxID=2975960 RepID=UPI00386CC62B|nr:protein kinase [Embleya sp. NBC_00888]